MLKFSVLFLLLLTTFSFQNCSPSQNDSAPFYPFSSADRYFRTSAKVVLEVYYEPGAEPFEGNSAKGRPYWKILEDNLAAIFQYRSRPPVLEVPKALNQMLALPAQNKTQWTNADLLALNGRHQQRSPTDEEARFYVYFLKGNFADEGGAQPGVLGVSINSTPVIAIFKDVIVNSGANPSGPVPKYVEQSTLVHEMGHALGFVNLEVPQATVHEDPTHQGHTSNEDCVMYWKNEGKSDLALFVQQFLTSGSDVMWGPEVLQDAQAYSR